MAMSEKGTRRYTYCPYYLLACIGGSNACALIWQTTQSHGIVDYLSHSFAGNTRGGPCLHRMCFAGQLELSKTDSSSTKAIYKCYLQAAVTSRSQKIN
eukprot:scaffold31408_cov35-Prasinocladus_malaysianus.AAC.1